MSGSDCFMIIIGIDPGETLIGFGIIKKDRQKLSLVDCGCIKIDPDGNKKKPTAEKLLELEEKLSKIILRYKPELAGVESIFFSKNTKTAINVAQARGVILATCQRNKIKICEPTPLQVKQAVAAYGRADKAQVQRMISLILNMDTPIIQDDTADAIATAIYAAHNSLVF